MKRKQIVGEKKFEKRECAIAARWDESIETGNRNRQSGDGQSEPAIEPAIGPDGEEWGRSHSADGISRTLARSSFFECRLRLAHKSEEGKSWSIKMTASSSVRPLPALTKH